MKSGNRMWENLIKHIEFLGSFSLSGVKKEKYNINIMIFFCLERNLSSINEVYRKIVFLSQIGVGQIK